MRLWTSDAHAVHHKQPVLLSPMFPDMNKLSPALPHPFKGGEDAPLQLAHAKS